MGFFPLQIQRQDAEHIRIEWNDGQKRLYSGNELRKACPCALCKSRENTDPNALPILTESDLQPIQIKNMTPVGHYAYSIEFSDGHTTGIYPLEYLHSLGNPAD